MYQNRIEQNTHKNSIYIYIYLCVYKIFKVHQNTVFCDPHETNLVITGQNDKKKKNQFN